MSMQNIEKQRKSGVNHLLIKFKNISFTVLT